MRLVEKSRRLADDDLEDQVGEKVTLPRPNSLAPIVGAEAFASAPISRSIGVPELGA